MYFVSQQDIYVNTYKYSIILIIVKHKFSISYVCEHVYLAIQHNVLLWTVDLMIEHEIVWYMYC